MLGIDLYLLNAMRSPLVVDTLLESTRVHRVQYVTSIYIAPFYYRQSYSIGNH